MIPTTTQSIHDCQQIYLQTNRILNAHSLHFILISLPFVPFTFFASSASQFYFSSSDVTTEFDPFNLLLIKSLIFSLHTIDVKTLITILTFTFFVILATVVSIALITYSTNQAMQHKPLSFSSTFKSLSHSYIPLLSTLITGTIKLIFIFLLFTLSPLAITQAVKSLGFHFGQFLLSIFLNIISSYALIFIILFLITLWGSAASIAVLESKSRLEPLQQSENQSTEFRYHSFSILFITAFAIVPALSYSSYAIKTRANWILMLQVLAIYLQSSLMILYYVVANTVLYVQHKDVTNTVVAGKVSGEYVKVVGNEDDGDVVHVVTKEEATGGFNYMMFFLLIVWPILLFHMWGEFIGFYLCLGK